MKTINLRREEVRQLLDEGKARIVRMMRVQPETNWHVEVTEDAMNWYLTPPGKVGLYVSECISKKHAPILPGSELVGRETWFLGCLDFEGQGRGYVVQYQDGVQRQAAFDNHISALADPYSKYAEGWHSPATMPAWASRLSLIVDAVTVERANDKWVWCYEMRCK